jgi:hemin uptake protein HemP
MNKHTPPELRFVRREPAPVQFDQQTTYVREPVRTLTSESLFLGTHEIGIAHAGALYRLKITRQGKLILNK